VLFAQEAVDSTAIVKIDSTKSTPKKKEVYKNRFKYYRVGIDLSKLVRSTLTDKYSTAEFLVETIYKPKLHIVAEGGWASSTKEGPARNIEFTSSSYFMRAGFDKYFFGKLYKQDLDNAFVGLRLGSAFLNRQQAKATLWDPFYGNQSLTFAPDRRLLHWIELTAGFRMEVVKNIFLGWNIRGKTFLNGGKLKERTPIYLSGYGIAEKQPGIDYSFYVLYGFGKQ